MKRIFLVGASRSGTTILQSLLAAHPSIISFPETKFFQYLLSPYENAISLEEGLKKFFIDKINEPRFLSYFNTNQSELEKANTLIAVLDTLAIEQNKSIWLEKTPQHIYYIDYLEKLLPDALFIHILRNGMDVIASMYEATRKDSGPDAWSSEWSIDFCRQRWQEAISISYKNAKKNNHILVKYEDFVENPRLTLSNICEFAQIEFDDLMLSRYKETSQKLSLGEPWHKGIERNIERSNSHKYYSAFKEKEIEDLINKIRPLTDEISQKERVEITRSIVDIFAPLSFERLLCRVEMEGEYLGNIELPFCDGVVSRFVLADAIATKFYLPILHRFFETKIGKNQIKVIDSLTQNQQSKKVWQVFLQDICGQAEWSLENFYNPELFEAAIAKHIDTKLLTIELSEPLKNIEISLPEIDVLLTVGGVPIGIVTVPVKENSISAQTLRTTLIKASGFELCRVCVREVLLGKPLNDSTSLRSHLVELAKTRTRFPDWLNAADSNGIYPRNSFLLGRNLGRIGSSTNRRATLPMGMVTELTQLWETTGSPILTNSTEEKLERVIYAPELLLPKSPTSIDSPEFQPSQDVNKIESNIGGKLLGAFALANFPGKFRLLQLNLKCHLEPLTNRQLYKGLAQFTARNLDNSNSSLATRATAKMPILRYRHVCPQLEGATVGYNVTPDNFEKQLQYLSENNFYSAVWEDWEKSTTTGTLLPGKPILITFDGGYLDFFNYAWPLLKRYGFNATVLLVAERIGTTNSWERADSPEVPLLGWPEICQLRDEGVEFGSLGATYQPLSLLSPTEIVQEAVRSRSILEQGLGRSVKTFAYPYGDFDPVVQHLIGACGYTYGLSCLSGINGLNDRLLALRRIDLMGSDSLSDFATQLSYKLPIVSRIYRRASEFVRHLAGH
ncbi:sulfotransferase [Kamptonema animale CS-326]|uniref:sulfotransferase n=1 Tax=Kamptonema animale TaxID=92934 RepID=UPI00232EE590|nr:sulfotransferase [Kamptonema animale]MDB9509909.1 sulfotransferase [Kamptonema animale CS-326]